MYNPIENVKNWLLAASLAVLAVAGASAQPYAYVANVAGNSVSVVNTSSMTAATTIFLSGSPSGLAMTPDGSTIYLALQGANSVAVISTASNSVVTTIPVGTTPVELAVSPNGAQVIVVNRGANTVSVIDTASKTVTATIPVGSRPIAATYNASGSRAYVTNLYDGTVTMIDTAAKASLGAFAAASGPSGIAVLGNGNIYVGNQYSSAVTVHDSNGNLLTTIGGFVFPNWVAATPDGSRVFVTNGNGGSVSAVNTSTNSIIATIPTGSLPTSVAVSTDGAYAYVTNEYSFTLSQISVASNTLVGSFHGGPYPFAVATQPAAAGAPPPPPPPCSYTLSSNSASFTAAGGTGSVNVTAPSGCAWTAGSNAAWAQITSGSSGSGNGTVNYSVSPNAGLNGLTGTLTIAGQTFTINESGVACGYSLSANSVSMGSGAGTGSVNAITQSACGWTASSDQSWLSITAGFSGTGNGTVSYSVIANNSTTSRTGHLNIGGQTYTVTQAGTAFTPIRLNCGGPQVTDSGGNVWSADNAQNYNVTNAAIANTTTPALYQSEAWSKSTLQYQFTVPNGSFTVQLKFAEFYMTQAGQRTFNIVINGTTYYSSYDIFAAVGANTADDLSIPVVVSGGQITIQLVPVTGPAKINAIQIF